MVEKLDRAVNLRLCASIYEELEKEAAQNGRKLSDHIRYVLDRGLQALRQEDPPPNYMADLQEQVRQLERIVRRSSPRRGPKKKRRPPAS